MSVENISIKNAGGVVIALWNTQPYVRLIYIKHIVKRMNVISITHKSASQIGATKYVTGGQIVSLGT